MSNPTAIAQRQAAREYLAGAGVSLLLVAAAVSAFLALGAFIAFSGLPFSGRGDGTSNVTIRSHEPAAGPKAPARHLTRPGGSATTPHRAANGGGAGAGKATATGASTGGTSGTANGGTAGGGTTGAGAGPADGSVSEPIAPTDPAPSPPTSNSGILGGTTQSADKAASNLGVDTNLSGTTAPVTGPGDQAVDNTLNSVGSGLGDPTLGDDTTTAVNGLTDSLPGGG